MVFFLLLSGAAFLLSDSTCQHQLYHIHLTVLVAFASKRLLVFFNFRTDEGFHTCVQSTPSVRAGRDKYMAQKWNPTETLS